MRRALLVTLSLLAITAGLISLAAWEPWRSREREHEVEWIKAYVAWTDRVDTGLSEGDYAPGARCDETYPTQVGDPPARLVAASRIVLAGCGRLRDAIAADEPSERELAEWYDVRDAVLADLTDQRTRSAAPERSPKLAAQATRLAGARPEAFCWSDTHWEELSEEWRLIRVDELWPIGFADRDGWRIHLAPQICAPLDRFFGGSYSPNLNLESLDLAIALVTLAHEAEHLRSPEATEAQVECVAIQRVRDLVRAAGRSKAYEDLMTGLAWDVGYPDVPPEYRTAECRDGSALDVRPETTVWP